jgi:plasmid stabilization system protein ParE
MSITWSEEADNSLFEILQYYENKVSQNFADSIEDRIIKQVDKIEGFELSIPESEIFPTSRKLVIKHLPYIAYIRQNKDETWEVVDIIHTSRKLPKK